MLGIFPKYYVQIAFRQLKFLSNLLKGQLLMQMFVHITYHIGHMAVLLQRGVVFFSVIRLGQYQGENLGYVDKIPRV